MNEPKIYVSMKVDKWHHIPVPSEKRPCSGGCGDMVWLDKRTEYMWSKIPILCLECALKEINEDATAVILPESIDSLMELILKTKRHEDESS